MKACGDEMLVRVFPCLTAKLNVALNRIYGKLQIVCVRGTLWL